MGGPWFEATPAPGLLDAGASLDDLAEAVDGCRACPLYARATQGVFGQGPAEAVMMLVGEQPGDREDEVGEPFVGPAGSLLDKALRRAGIDREAVYVTNVVKHFKWKPGPPSKPRLHAKPNKPRSMPAVHGWRRRRRRSDRTSSSAWGRQLPGRCWAIMCG